jgi:hypothetical protein
MFGTNLVISGALVSSLGMSATPKSDAAAKENDPRSQLRFPSWYNPYTPESIERRRKLFEDIARNRTPESDEAMEKLYRMFADDDENEIADTQ